MIRRVALGVAVGVRFCPCFMFFRFGLLCFVLLQLAPINFVLIHCMFLLFGTSSLNCVPPLFCFVVFPFYAMLFSFAPFCDDCFILLRVALYCSTLFCFTSLCLCFAVLLHYDLVSSLDSFCLVLPCFV